MAQSSAPSSSPGWRRLLTVVVLVCAFGYLTRMLWSEWDQLASQRWTVHWPLCAASFGLVSGWFVLRTLLWRTVLRGFGHELPFRAAFRMWALSELGRYLPGKVWYPLGRGHLAARHGIPTATALTAMLLELLLVLLGAVVAFLLTGEVGAGVSHSLRLLAPVLVAAALALSHPAVLRLVFCLLRRDPPPRFPSTRNMLTCLAFTGLLWVAAGLAFALFAASVVPAVVKDAPPLALAGAWTGAWALGLLSVVSPGGLGVREGVLAALLSPLLGPGPAALLALASRVWITLAEGLWAGLALLVRETEDGEDRQQLGGASIQ